MNEGVQRRWKSDRSGFTLIELVITIVVVSVIAVLAAMIILQGAGIFSTEQSRSSVDYQSRLAVERITRESRLIRSCADIAAPANPSNTLAFTDIDGNAVSFTASGGALYRGGILLASGIASPSPFRFLDRSGNPTTSCAAPNDVWFIEIDLTETQGGESLSLRTRVHPRNF